MRKVSAFCPAYITGLFTIGKGDAAGAGFAIDRGLATTVSEKKSGGTKITINGKGSAAPVSKAVLSRYSEICGKAGALEIRHETAIPVGFGLGMSAAGALSLSLALNELLGAGLSRKECVKNAHDADVECGTGLSGADAAAIGGMLARRSVRDGVVKLPFEERNVEIAFYSPIRTASVIRSPGWKERVNAAGEKSLSLLFREKSWDGFVEASRLFAAQSGLADWCAGEMERNGRASMAMLGRTLFSDRPMQLRKMPPKLLKAKTREGGAELV